MKSMSEPELRVGHHPQVEKIDKNIIMNTQNSLLIYSMNINK